MPDRRESPGRRDEDHYLANIARQFARLEGRFDTTLEKLDARVDAIEDFHLKQQAVAEERFAARTRRGEQLGRWSLLIGIASGLVGIGATVIAVVSG